MYNCIKPTFAANEGQNVGHLATGKCTIYYCISIFFEQHYINSYKSFTILVLTMIYSDSN